MGDYRAVPGDLNYVSSWSGYVLDPDNDVDEVVWLGMRNPKDGTLVHQNTSLRRKDSRM